MAASANKALQHRKHPLQSCQLIWVELEHPIAKGLLRCKLTCPSKSGGSHHVARDKSQQDADDGHSARQHQCLCCLVGLGRQHRLHTPHNTPLVTTFIERCFGAKQCRTEVLKAALLQAWRPSLNCRNKTCRASCYPSRGTEADQFACNYQQLSSRCAWRPFCGVDNVTFVCCPSY